MPIGYPLQPGHLSHQSLKPEWEGPEPYLFNIAGRFGRVQGELHMTLNIYIELHQHAYSSFRRRDDNIELMVKDLKAQASISEEAQSDSEDKIRKAYAKMSYINALDHDLTRSVRTINRMFVVALWALAEQFLGKMFKEVVSFRTGIKLEKAPYRWDDFKIQYANESLDLATLHDYEIANECRILNNCFKHAETVSNKLAAFAPYSTKIGARLDDLDIDPPRYLNAISNFLGSLIENCNKAFLLEDEY